MSGDEYPYCGKNNDEFAFKLLEHFVRVIVKFKEESFPLNDSLQSLIGCEADWLINRAKIEKKIGVSHP